MRLKTIQSCPCVDFAAGSCARWRLDGGAQTQLRKRVDASKRANLKLVFAAGRRHVSVRECIAAAFSPPWPHSTAS